MRKKNSYEEVINNFNQKHVLVIGDLMLDVLLKGNSTRLSAEAPVPVVDVQKKIVHAGGAGNMISNLRSLGATVTLCTVVGTDPDGDEAVRLIESTGVKRTTIHRTPARVTFTKTRIVAGNQVITRLDHGTQTPLDSSDEEILIQFITQSYETCDAVLISELNLGVVTEKILSAITRLQARWPKFLVVDSKRPAFYNKLHPYLVKPNYEEAIRVLELPYLLSGRAEQIKLVSSDLYEKFNAEIIAVTLDAEGAMVIEMGQAKYKCIAPAMEATNTGSGDTFLVAFLLSYITCIDLELSAEMANAASAIALGKEGQVLCSNVELRNHFNMKQKWVQALDDLEAICEQYRADKKKIVFTHERFDSIHSGHVTFLHCAKELGDVLIVAIDEDRVKTMEGEVHSVSVKDRVKGLSALTSVDYLFVLDHSNPDSLQKLIEVIKPDVIAGGAESVGEVNEKKNITDLHLRYVMIPQIPEHSTTSILKSSGPSSGTPDQSLVTKLN